jgi:hypothetical protein
MVRTGYQKWNKTQKEKKFPNFIDNSGVTSRPN